MMLDESREIINDVLEGIVAIASPSTAMRGDPSLTPRDFAEQRQLPQRTVRRPFSSHFAIQKHKLGSATNRLMVDDDQVSCLLYVRRDFSCPCVCLEMHRDGCVTCMRK